MEDFTMKLRALTLKESSTGGNYLKCDFAVSSNKYAKTYATNIFENGSDAVIFKMLCEDFGIETLDEVTIVDCKEEFEGSLFTADVSAHYIEDMDGNRVTRKVKNSKGKMVEEPVIATTLTAIFIEDWGQTQESVINRFERQWEKHDLLVPTDEEE